MLIGRFAQGFAYTLVVAFSALALALLIGIILGIASCSNIKPLELFSRIYVEFQNTPLLIQIFFLYNGLRIQGIVLSVTTIGIIGVGMYHGAISPRLCVPACSIAKGQLEAAYSQGFTYWQAMTHIILPQAKTIICRLSPCRQ